MELVLKEWIGADGQWKSLCDADIVNLNYDYFIDNDIKGLIDDEESVIGNGKKENKNKSRADKEKFDNVLKVLGLKKGKGKESLKKSEIRDKISENLQGIKEFSNDLIHEISKINLQHKKEVGNDANPICEFAVVNGNLFVKTYQYAAEFEVCLSKDKKLKIKIEPRDLVSPNRFEEMINYVFNIHTLDDVSGMRSCSFVVLYYIAFLRRLKTVLNGGIYREYVDKEDNLTYLKERLLLAEHIRENWYTKDRLYCGFSEFSSDNIINRTIKYTLKCLKKRSRDNRELGGQIRDVERYLLQEDIADCPVDEMLVSTIHYNRFNRPYQEVMKYCVNILKKIGGSFSSNSDIKYAAFYIDMNELFESYVAKKFKERDNGVWKVLESEGENKDEDKDSYEVYAQYESTLDEGAVFKIRPDIVLKKNNEVSFILDTKYKRLNSRRDLHYGISQSDVYQMIAYAKSLNCNKVYLVYPLNREMTEEECEHELKIGEITIHTRCIDCLNSANS